MQVPKKGDPDYTDYVIRMSSAGLIRQGVINEPRVFWDEIAMDPASAVTVRDGTPGVFVNGENVPVRLTHMLAAPRFLDQANAIDNTNAIQRMALRMRFHDQYYMNPQFVALPAWANKPVAMSQPQGNGNSHWDLVENGQPFVLSARDTLVVTVEAQQVGDGEEYPVTVSVTGIGAISRRPYFLSGQVVLTDTTPTNLSTVDFRNDGSEPIVCTDLTVNVGGDVAGAPLGDIGRVRINIRQSGNGTGASWFSGPRTPVNISNMQATLLGVSAGVGVVHQFPGDGLIWEPGAGISVEAQNFLVAGNSVLCLALAGYVMVT